MIDINDDPVLTNLPDSINVLENLPLATSVFQASVNDTDSSDPKVFRASFDKEWAAQYFTVNSSSTVPLQVLTFTCVVKIYRFSFVLSIDAIYMYVSKWTCYK